MARRPEFKRMVVGLPQSAADYPSVEAVASLAELLRLNLVGTFVEDENLLLVAGLPGAREWRPLGGGWRPIETAKLVGEMANAAGAARRLFESVVQHRSIETSFCLARGSAADAICATTTTEDILVVIEPRNPLERVSRPFNALLDAAFKATAAVMIIPSRMVRSTGPIVVIPAGPDDPSIPSAFAIAAAMREKVIVLSSPELSRCGPELARIAEAAGVHAEFRSAARGPWTVPMLGADLSHIRERLMILTRGMLKDSEVAELSSLRGTPVFVIEPDGKAESATSPLK